MCQDNTEGNGEKSYKNVSWADNLCYSPGGNENEIIYMNYVLVAVENNNHTETFVRGRQTFKGLTWFRWSKNIQLLSDFYWGYLIGN